MATNSAIILSSNPKGVFLEGTISGTDKPGTCMEVVAATEPVAGRFTYRFQQPTNDTDPRATIVLLEDSEQGKLVTDAYVTGTRCFLYCPALGEELNMRVKDISGTGDDHAIGDRFAVDHTTGKLIVATTANRAPFVCLETATDPTADALLRCMFAGGN